MFKDILMHNFIRRTIMAFDLATRLPNAHFLMDSNRKTISSPTDTLSDSRIK